MGSIVNWLPQPRIRLPAFLGIGLLVLVLAGDLARVYQGWTVAEGWEYEQIARAWADGKGYSFPGGSRWLFDPANPDDRTDPGGYYATAWEEPVPVFLLGTFFWLFGDYGRLAMTLTNALFFAATLVVVYHLGRRIQGPWLGLASAALLAMIPTPHSLVKVYLGGSVLGGLMVSICALLLLWFVERASVRRGLLLGAVLGTAALAQAATIVFIPVATLVALVSQRPLTWQVWRSAGVIVGTALLAISPWAVRNYATFGEPVLVRDGAGQIAYLGNRALAETVDPSLVPDDAPFKPPWTAGNPLQAMRLIDLTQNMIDIQIYADDTVGATAPEGYANFNEAQRDKVFMAEALGFMLRHPLITLQLAAAKAVKFLFPSELDWLHLIPVGCVSLLAALGLALNLKDRRVTALGLMALAYTAVYVVTFPYFYRYRYPIEPVLATLAGMAVIWLAQLGGKFRERLFGAPEADAAEVRARPGG
jgi:4-amino-4-deoxy-L-arabinose transferase-like glycosyltransferase